MVCNAKHCQPIFWLLYFLSLGLLRIYFSYQLILNEDKSLHGMLESQFVFAHLTKNSTNVQVNIRWIQHL